jgi:hypothetical protein
MPDRSRHISSASKLYSNYRNPSFPVLILCVLFLSSGKSLAQNRIIEATNAAAVPGATTTINLRLSDLQGFAGGDFRISFDRDLMSIVDVDRGPLTAGFFLAFDTPQEGLLAISLADVEGLEVSGQGIVAAITVQSLPTAVSGTRTLLVFQLARWYTEESVRNPLSAKNAIFEVGGTVPPEFDLYLSVANAEEPPGYVVSVPLALSFAEGVAGIGAEILFDETVLLNPQLQLSPALTGWVKTVTYDNGSIRFLLGGETVLQGMEPLEIGQLPFQIAPAGIPGTEVELTSPDLTIASLGGCSLLSWFEPGRVLVREPASSVESWRLYDSR